MDDSGKVKTVLSIATNRWSKDGEKTDWFRVELWDKKSEVAGEYAKKGSLIAIEGRLAQNKWTTPSGENREYYYEYLVGSKTGYTSISRQTLVSCAEKDGVKLICVILKEESPYQFEDTIALFNYGFSNFTQVSVADNETTYDINHMDFFDTESSLFGSSAPIISIDKNSTILLPNGVDFSELTSEIVYDNVEAPYFGMIYYYYNGYMVGTAGIAFAGEDQSVSFSTLEEARAAQQDAANSAEAQAPKKNVVLINIWSVIKKIFLVIFIIFIVLVVAAVGKIFIDKQLKLHKINKSRNRQITTRRDFLKRQRQSYKKRPGNNNPGRNNSSETPKKRNDVDFNDIKF